MSFLGIGGLELLLIFAVGMFFLGPRRLAEGVRVGRRYYRELSKYRLELSDMVKESIDAEGLKKDLEETRRAAWDEGASRQLAGLEKDLTVDEIVNSGGSVSVGQRSVARRASNPSPDRPVNEGPERLS